MRKVVILLLGLPFLVSAQINTLKIKENIVETFPIETASYDSLERIEFSNYKLHVKQTLYLPELRGPKNEGGYKDFYVKADNNTEYIYNPSKSKSYLSNYDVMANKYYYVNNIVIGEKGNKFLQLIKKDVGDTLYFHFEDNRKDFYTDFITVGYFEKMKSLYVGKEFVYIGNGLEGGSVWDANFYNIKDDTKKEFYSDTRFTCVDIVACNYLPFLEAVLRNLEGDFTVSVECLPSKFNKFRTLTEYKNEQAIKSHQYSVRKATLTKKYGAANAALIVKGQVKVGFTKQMCKESWGEPVNINTNTNKYGSSEQWVYSSNSYLYFENGRLTSIQN